MLLQEIIQKKKDGLSLSDSEIQYYIEGISNQSVSASNIAAFCIAVMFKGMSTEETFSLTDHMVKSGDKLKWDDLNGPVVDKHSTGGVGDKVSIMLAPIVASCGIYYPVICLLSARPMNLSFSLVGNLPRFVFTTPFVK